MTERVPPRILDLLFFNYEVVAQVWAFQHKSALRTIRGCVYALQAVYHAYSTRPNICGRLSVNLMPRQQCQCANL